LYGFNNGIIVDDGISDNRNSCNFHNQTTNVNAFCNWFLYMCNAIAKTIN
jgi:hypothetical protein